MPRKVGPIDYKYLPTTYILQFIIVRLIIMRILLLLMLPPSKIRKISSTDGFILGWL